MTDRVPLAEQLDELSAEYTRRCRAYPLLVARGEMREKTAEMKIERLGAAHNTMAWVLRHADDIRQWMLYATKISPVEERAAIIFDAPMEVEPDGETQEDIHPDEDETSGDVGVSSAAE
jgi:hypothetical protein